jgi:hypothetical protein
MTTSDPHQPTVALTVRGVGIAPPGGKRKPRAKMGRLGKVRKSNLALDEQTARNYDALYRSPSRRRARNPVSSMVSLYRSTTEYRWITPACGNATLPVIAPVFGGAIAIPGAPGGRSPVPV